MFKLFLWLVIFGGLSAGAFAAGAGAYPPGTLHLRTGITLPSIPLQLSPTDSADKGPQLDYQQNASPRLGVGFDYGILGVFVTFYGLATKYPELTYGKTEYFDFQLHSYFGPVTVDFTWQDFKGYYLANTQTFYPAATSPLLRTDLYSRNRSGNVVWIRHPERVSLEASGNATAKQTSSGGSWMWLATYAFQTLGSDATLAPPDLRDSFGRLGQLTKGNFQGCGIGPGYAYNWVFLPKFFFHIALSVALGPQFQKYETLTQGSFSEVEGSGRANGRIGVGYNGDTFFAGAVAISDSNGFQMENRTLLFTSTYSFMYAGIRL